MVPKKINDCIRDLWKNNYFISPRTPKEIEKYIFKKYSTTVSNMTPHLVSCSSFLRKQNGSWIQKKPFEDIKTTDKSDIFSISTKQKVLIHQKTEMNLFDLMKIHPEIRKASEKLYNDKHYDLAIFEAIKKINNLVKDKTQSQEDGKTLMMNVFNELHPTLQFNSLKSVTDKDIQEGRKFLLAGAIIGIRNPRGHDDVVQKNPITDPILAMKYLCYASLLTDYVDEAYLSKK